MKRAVPSAVGVAFALALCSGPCAAQPCTPQWWNANQGLEPQLVGAIVPHVFAEFDLDGAGPLARHLYTAGFFTFNDGLTLTPGIARWDGFQWTSVGQGLGAGGINFIYALQEYDPDANGPAPPSLIASGAFGNAGGVQVKNIARWDGSAWSALGTAIPGADNILAMASYDHDGPGPILPSLVVSGSILNFVDGTPCRYVARWDGAAWHNNMQLPSGMERFYALRSFDPDGAGPMTPILLGWSGQDPYGIFRWTGSGWVYTGLALEATHGPIVDTSSASVMWDSDGAGPIPPMLHVCGPNGLRRWVSGGWQMVPNSAGGGSLLTLVDEDGPGPEHPKIFSVKLDHSIVRWSGSQWTSIGIGGGGGAFSGAPYAIAGFDIDGPGPRPGSLFVGGEILSVSGVPAHGLARYGCEETWSPCVGDVNNDLLVNFTDITDILTNWGLTGSTGDPAYGDANHDNIVGFTDITAVLTSFGQDCNTAARPRAEPVNIAVDPGSPLGRIIDAHREGGFSAITRALAEWRAGE